MNFEAKSDPQEEVLEATRKLAERLVASLAEQWNGLSSSGRFMEKKQSILDPEVMLLSTWRWGRTEPRIFDEALRWSCYLGEEIDVSRLQALLKEEGEKDLTSLAGAFAYIVVDQGKQKRWEKIANLTGAGTEPEPLFLNKDGTPSAIFGEADRAFLRYGWLRGSFVLRSAPASGHLADARAGLRFLLRHLVGMGCKAEALLALLTREACTVKEIAGCSGYSDRGVLLALDDLEKTGIVESHAIEGAKRRYPSKRYRLDQPRWWNFLEPQEQARSGVLRDTLRIYRAASVVWKALTGLSAQTATAYKVRSVLARASKDVQVHLSQAGLRPTLVEGSEGTLDGLSALLAEALVSPSHDPSASIQGVQSARRSATK